MPAFIEREGPSTFLRELARLIRPAEIIPVMETWIEETRGDSKFYSNPGLLQNGQGFGLTHASRGALGHWVKIQDEKIESYQIITPSA